MPQRWLRRWGQTLSKLSAHGLANLLEGRHPAGLRLVMQGQGKGWKPLVEGAVAHTRIMKVGRFVDEQLAKG